jgi:hypothetical protein
VNLWVQTSKATKAVKEFICSFFTIRPNICPRHLQSASRLQTYGAFFFRSALFLNSAIMLNKKEELSCYNTLIFRGTSDAGFLTKRHLVMIGQQTMVFLVATNKIERSSCGRDNGH